jgi:hypothetical protein
MKKETKETLKALLYAIIFFPFIYIILLTALIITE